MKKPKAKGSKNFPVPARKLSDLQARYDRVTANARKAIDALGDCSDGWKERCEKAEAERDVEKEIAWREVAKNTDLNAELQDAKAERDRLAAELANVDAITGRSAISARGTAAYVYTLAESHRELLEALRVSKSYYGHQTRFNRSTEHWECVTSCCQCATEAAIAKAEEIQDRK